MRPSLMSSVWHWLWLHGGMHVHPQINIGSKALKIYMFTHSQLQQLSKIYVHILSLISLDKIYTHSQPLQLGIIIHNNLSLSGLEK